MKLRSPARPHDPWWHIVGLISGLLFTLMLAAARLRLGWLDHIDSVLEAPLAAYRTMSVVEFFLAVTVLGSMEGVTSIALGAAYFLRSKSHKLVRLFLLIFLSSSSTTLAKAFVERARPDAVPWIQQLNNYSFPSWHATLSTALYGYLAVILYRRCRHYRAARIAVVILCGIVVALVCLSRLILNVHYVTDVTAGVLLGLFWLAVIFMIPEKYLQLR
jgi:undecaprenyl-diphosphatase